MVWFDTLIFSYTEVTGRVCTVLKGNELEVFLGILGNLLQRLGRLGLLHLLLCFVLEQNPGSHHHHRLKSGFLHNIGFSLLTCTFFFQMEFLFEKVTVFILTLCKIHKINIYDNC